MKHRVIFLHGDDPAVIAAARQAKADGEHPILVANGSTLEFESVYPPGSPRIAAYAKRYMEDHGVTEEEALANVRKPRRFAELAVLSGDADEIR